MPVVAAICRRLDGMPLAIEFAAAYAGTLGVAALATRLEDRLSLLSGRRNAALERHHTLQATHDLSYGLLDEGERAILRRLAVFTGKFTVEAAARVGADTSLGPSDAIDRLADLVQKSLVTVDMGAPVTSYRLLHTTRAYASQKLLESGEGAGAASRHAAYHADLLLRAWEDRANLFGAGGYDLYKDQIDDIRAALEWAFSPAGNLELGIRLSAGASICFIELGMMIEARDWSHRGLDAIKSAAAEPQCERLLQYGLTHSLVITRGNIEVALKALLKTLEMTQAAGDADLEMRTLGGFHIFQTRSGAYNGAMTTALRAADVAAPDDPEAMAMAAGMLAQSYHFAGDQKKAEIYCRDCLRFAPLSQRVNTIRFGVDQRIRAQSVNARLLWLLGRPDQALDAARAMVAFGLDSGDPVVDAMSCDYAINVAFLYGDWTWGEQLVDRIDRLGREHLIQPYETLARRYRSELAYRAGEIDGLREQELAYQRVADIGLNPAFPAISLIEGLIAGSRFAEAQALISDIKARMLREGQSLYAPEYDRMQGKVFAAQGDAEAAILAFERALSLARVCSGVEEGPPNGVIGAEEGPLIPMV